MAGLSLPRLHLPVMLAAAAVAALSLVTPRPAQARGPDNIADVAAMEVDLIVTGSAVFDGKAAEANARFMLEAVKPGARN